MLNARQQRIKLFSITLDSLNRIIKDRKQKQQPVKLKEFLENKVPNTYYCHDHGSCDLDGLARPLISIMIAHNNCFSSLV